MGWDEGLPPEMLTSICFQNNQYRCSPSASVDPSGAFTLTVPEMGGLTLWSMASRQLDGGASTETSYATRTLSSCPASPVQLTLDQGYVMVAPILTLTGPRLSWTPAGYGASVLEVFTTSGLKWIVTAEGGGLSSPITYGTLPAGATQDYPSSGAPAALASGDQVILFLNGTTAGGLPYYGTATLVVP